MKLRTRVKTLLVPVAGLLVATCGGGNTTPTSNPPTTPTTTPTPVPTPTPEPLPFGITAVCHRIGMGTEQTQCHEGGSGSFQTELDAAIDDVVRHHPEIFDFGDTRGAGGFRVVSLGLFYVELLKSLENANLCAVFDGEEVAIKNSQAFSDQYKVVLSTGHLRRGESQYRARCSPAAIPLAVGQPAPVAGCPLAPSRSVACGNENARYADDVENAILKVQREHPDFFDGETVRNVRGYENAIVDVLSAQGYCAVPGEELGIKRINDLSESYDILLANGKIRHTGYRVTCYPADF